VIRRSAALALAGALALAPALPVAAQEAGLEPLDLQLELLDARNHGASPHVPHMDYASLAADVVAFMDEHDLDRAVVVGHSMGGKTAMRLALDQPQRVSRLMVVDIAPDLSGSDHLPLIQALETLPLADFQRRADADAALAASVPDAGLRAFLLQSLASGPEGLRWRLNLPAIRQCMPALLAFDTVIASPHTAGVTIDSRATMARYAATQLIDLLDGKPPARSVNPEVFERYRERFAAILGRAPDSF